MSFMNPHPKKYRPEYASVIKQTSNQGKGSKEKTGEASRGGGSGLSSCSTRQFDFTELGVGPTRSYNSYGPLHVLSGCLLGQVQKSYFRLLKDFRQWSWWLSCSTWLCLFLSLWHNAWKKKVHGGIPFLALSLITRLYARGQQEHVTEEFLYFMGQEAAESMTGSHDYNKKGPHDQCPLSCVPSPKVPTSSPKEQHRPHSEREQIRTFHINPAMASSSSLVYQFPPDCFGLCECSLHVFLDPPSLSSSHRPVPNQHQEVGWCGFDVVIHQLFSFNFLFCLCLLFGSYWEWNPEPLEWGKSPRCYTTRPCLNFRGSN